VREGRAAAASEESFFWGVKSARSRLDIGVGRNSRIVITTSQGPDQAIARLADDQHGNVSYAQLRAIGLSHNAIAHRVKTGRLHRVYRGVYSVGRPPKTAHEHAMAAVLACGDGAALSHHSALALWGLAEWKWSGIHVTVPGDRRPKGIKVHRASGLTSREFRKHQGIRMTSPARTILDCAPTLTDKALRRAVNDARRSPQAHVRPWHLEDIIERFPYHPGAKKLRPILEIKGGPTRSDWEDGFPAFCKQFDLPDPVLSTYVAGHEVDALWPEHKIIIELDSWDFHQDRDAFETDRDRDADTLAAGYLTIRITWERIDQCSTREAARLHEIIRQWGRRAAETESERSS
jgi:hypothetical protein